jgi:hypothetical protein
MSTPAGLQRFDRSMTTRYAGKCSFCSLSTMPDSDFAARSGDKWIAVCRSCAGSVAAQVRAMVLQMQNLVTASPLTDAQTLAIQTLLPGNDDMAAAMADGATDAQAVPVLAKLDAATVALRSLTGTPATVRSNKYSGKCGTCGTNVAEGAGRIEKIGGKWTTFHLAGKCATAATPAAPVASVECGLYQHDNGTVRKVYMTQNDRMACKVLVVLGTTGSFQYEKGGTRIVGSALADGTAHLMTQDEAAAFGRQHSFCCNCALDLTDDRSLAAGYGPVCASHNGWWYPSYTEAAVILQRPVTGPNGKVIEPPAA